MAKHASAPAVTPSATATKTSCSTGNGVAAVAPFVTTPSRKLTQLLATSAPSRVGSEPQLHAEGARSGWRSALWPSSPVFRKKLHSNAPSNQSPSKCASSSRALERELMAPIPLSLKQHVDQREPQDDDDNDSDDNCAPTAPRSLPASLTASREFSKSARASALHSLDCLKTVIPVLSVRLHGGDLHVQSAEPQQHVRVSKPAVLDEPAPAPATLAICAPLPLPLPADVLTKRSSLEQELDEFMANADAKIVIFPDYFVDDEKELVKRVAEELRLGCQIGERNVAVFKTGESCDKACPRVRSRSSVTDASDDVYVDVSELAQQGKDCFIARLRLRRLSSGSGVRRNMLWDVAELTQRDGIADPVSEGEGGVYAVQSRSSGQKLAMFKPAEEEKFVRDGLVPGEGAVREEAAYVLDSRSNGFSGVPPTAVARLQLSNIGRAKQGAVQRFMASSIGSMEGFGMPFDLAKADAFVPVEQVHRIGLLDVRVFNTDRHPGNILLIGDRAPYTMAPIDHGCILPSWFHLSEARFDWLEYPQCKVPFSAAAMEYIASLDASGDAQALRKLGIREECVTTLKICTLFLQRAALAGRSLFWIGSFMQREGCFETPSKLELLVQRACDASNIPFTFVPSAFGEQKGSIAPGILSRRPPQQFFDALETLIRDAVAAAQ